MHRRQLLLLVTGALAARARAAHAQSVHTEADAIALVDRAADYLNDHTRAEALDAFSDPHGSFRDGDLYLFVQDAGDDRLVMLAHGANRGLIGMPQRDVVDAEGNDFNARIVALTRDGGAGWIDYKWPNPVTRKIAAKRTYVRRVGTLIIGAGLYR